MVRFKQRYLLVRVATREGHCRGLAMGDVLNALRRSLEKQLGAWGYGTLRASLNIKYWNPDTGMLIGWFAITALTEVKERACVMSVMHTGGTIRVVKKCLLQYQLDQQRAALAL